MHHRFLIVLSLLLLSMAAAPSAVQAQVVPTRTVVAGGAQTVLVGRTAAERFAVRLTDAQGAALAGVRVNFYVNVCIDIGLPPPGGGCPTNLYGSFVPVAPGTATTADVLTDANGIATAPPFIAGATPGTYGIIAFVPAQQAGAVTIAASPSTVLFTITQVQAFSIPATGTWALLAFALLAMAVASRRLVVRR